MTTRDELLYMVARELHMPVAKVKQMSPEELEGWDKEFEKIPPTHYFIAVMAGWSGDKVREIEKSQKVDDKPKNTILAKRMADEPDIATAEHGIKED